MRKIIDGKLYDTDKAQQVGEPWGPAGLGTGDLDWLEETLYRKRTGEYFLHGEGGPRTRYAEPYGQSSWTGGERIMPLSYDEAREWAEEHLGVDDYEAEFGTPDEGETAVLSLTVPMTAYRAIKDEATRRGCPMRDLIVEYAGTLP
ncbi:MAG: hypothetical protein MR415_08320 [Coriobacteriaceae bacterium]|uniref:hypothetical protein n=1 Tax=Tractidigestivibacter sp. TaxID=2847320 RepID=UPI002A909D6C|nr:hypothetical protein [Tractidigestivibacter sp.]MCI6548634.1 hypothetical protein [Coriobacteriaceae bacterium]MDD7584710.1 hypothetical protein [Coriobacteriaceae bacterium]MDY5272516.1 hypothetical protein [Tractidigestivibacter sp.]